MGRPYRLVSLGDRGSMLYDSRPYYAPWYFRHAVRENCFFLALFITWSTCFQPVGTYAK